MHDRSERRRGGATDCVDDALRFGQLGMCVLQVTELPLQAIEVGVGQFGRVLLVVEAAVVGDELSELGDSAGGVEFCGHGAMLSRACVATFGAVNLVELQLLRVLWLVLPFVAGPVFEAAMDDGERSLQIGGGVLLWVVWGALLITLMVPRTESLTVIRVGIPGALPLLLWALLAGGADAEAAFVALSTAIAAICGLLAWRPPIGDAFVDGSSYGDERRFLLRTPGALAIGPLFVVCAVIIAGLTHA